MPSSSIIIKKKVGEKLAVGMDFGPWMQSGDTISTINDVTTSECDGATPPTFSNEAISGTNVNFFVEGGTSGYRYTIIVNITTSAGEILIGDGQLVVL
jgi:hypothetical protein